MAGDNSLIGLDWIAADWGTSGLRIWALAKDGTVLARTSSDDGMRQLGPDGYEPALLKLAGGWLADQANRPLPVIICGMAGARHGWHEALYRRTPCAPVAGGQKTPVATADKRISVFIVSGICQDAPPDVMRGEETQLAGLVENTAGGDAAVCLPGTHSKWVRLQAGWIAGFKTFMTGELFALSAAQSILRHSVGTEREDRQAFLGGVAEMLADPSGLTAAMFSIRAASLLGDTSAEASRSRLSGLLIGAELAATRDQWSSRPVHLIGEQKLVAAYAAALESAGARTVSHDAEQLTLAGLAIARQAMREGGG